MPYTCLLQGLGRTPQGHTPLAQGRRLHSHFWAKPERRAKQGVLGREPPQGGPRRPSVSIRSPEANAKRPAESTSQGGGPRGPRACFLPDPPRLPRAGGRSRTQCGGCMEAGWRVDTCRPNLPGPRHFPAGSSHTAEHLASQKKWPVATEQILALRRKPLWPGIPVPGSQTETL